MFRVAVGLGKFPSEVLSMPAIEWDYLLAFYQLEPFGPRQTTLENAKVVCAVANSMVGAGLKPVDVAPTLEEPIQPNKGGSDFRKWALSRAPAGGNYA